MTGTRGLIGLIAMLALLTGFTAAAQTIESLVMPGDVVSAHTEIEPECSSCHKVFSKSAQRGLCLDCHEDIATDIEGELGFHGRFGDARAGDCSSCHIEHEGRDADIVGLDETTFDHAFTDFELLGKHLEAQCSDCHVPEEMHRDAGGECSGCHLESAHHENREELICANCHNEAGWTDVNFDHGSTDYSLIGKHLDATCVDCHKIESFSAAPDDCFGCHADDDRHNGRSGEQCQNCHNPEAWSDTSFDHARDTEFALLGRHEELSCEGCHSDDPFDDTPDTACIACHLEDDQHDSHNGTDCTACHSNDAWTDIRFEHFRDAGFKLNGAHAEVACVDCHVEPIFDESPATACSSCHLQDDVHKGSQGEKCADCHNETQWEDAPYFDHDLTRFPLLGEHDNIECDDCHETQVFVDADSECVGCHIDDDSHDGAFADSCESCHNPVAWDLWFFDHDLQTQFPLDGAHVEVVCSDCHRKPLAAMQKIGARCADCHRPDDSHDGEFGPDCGRCHSTRSFQDVRSLQ